MATENVPATPGRRFIRAGDVVVGLALLALLAFAPLARLVAGGEPLTPALGPPMPVRSEDRADHPLRALPAGLPTARLFRTPADLIDLADRALGPAGEVRLLALLDPTRPAIPDTIGEVGSRVPYPYRYPALDEMLDAAPGRGATPEARALGAALIVLAGQPNEFGGSRYGNAAPAAYAVLQRLRPGGDCVAQLDLQLLVASDVQPRDDAVQAETRQAQAVCPDDPTPAWILGQYLSQRAVLTVFINHGDPLPPNIQQRAASAFAGLQVLYPDSGPALTGAADAHLRLGIRLTERSPFRARQELRAAAAGYSRAIELHRDGAEVGLARALIGLGEPARAAEILHAAVGGARTPGPVLELTITAQEAAHDFAGAATTARRLADRAASAYSDGTRLFPLPGIAEESPYTGPPELLDPVGPQSAEATAAPLSTRLQPGEGGAGGTVDDLSFIPTYRPDYGSTVGTDPACAELSWRRATLLAGNPSDALAGIPAPTAEQTLADTGQAVRPGAACELNSGMLRDIALAEVGRPVPGDRQHQENVADARQNLWRWAGNLGRAERAVRAWQETVAGAGALAMLRLGEVQFLQHRYGEAAATFGATARRARQEDLQNDLDVDRALLDRGAALLRAGRSADGMTVLRSVDDAAGYAVAYHRAGKNSEGQQRFGAVAYHARAQLADAERDAGDAAAAVEDYDAARELAPLYDIYTRAPLRPERVDANEALAELDLGRVDAARASIERALRVDPANPVFLMTAGFVADRAGRTDLAARYDTQALASDPGAFPAANDLGVELARLHRRGEAVTALRRAVGARPDYALGWFNLGVVYAQQGRVLHAEGAFSRALQLDPALADKQRAVTIDGRIYRTGLDLSKPLPSRWSLARLPALAPAPAAGVLALLVLGLGLARAAATGSPLAPSWLEAFGDRFGNVLHLRAVGWALAATAVVFVVPALVRSPGAAPEVAALGAGVVLLALAAVRARAMVARRAGVAARAESWPPGVVFALVTAPIAPWAPLPVTRSTGTAPRLYAAAPVLLAAVGVLLFVETALLAVPLARALGTAALIMVASVLVPVEPLDGGKLGKAGLVAGAGVLGAAVLLALAAV